MENKNIRLVILLIIFSTLAVLQIYLFNKDFTLLSSLGMLFNAFVMACYAKGIINNLREK
ncbi:MAG: hypothetical protein GZ091_09920 [Paludibacter sp.]|nr:hypothetical protein [Paludibacter sp.]